MNITQPIEIEAIYLVPISTVGLSEDGGCPAFDAQHAALRAAMAVTGRLYGNRASGTWRPITSAWEGDGLG